MQVDNDMPTTLLCRWRPANSPSLYQPWKRINNNLFISIIFYKRFQLKDAVGALTVAEGTYFLSLLEDIEGLLKK
jgi:hypothetical protein